MAAKEAHGIEQECQAGLAGLVGEDLGIGQAGMVVDRQMQVFPALAALFAGARVALAGPVARDAVVIPPFLTGCIRRIHAAIFSFWAGVMPPMPMFGRSLLYVQSHCVA